MLKKEKKTKLKKQPLVIALAVITALTLAVPIVYGQKFEGKLSAESQNASEKTIVGVWRTVVTLRNCQTGDPVAPSFQGLFTFHKDGIMSEWGIGPGGTPALRSPGTGFGIANTAGRITRSLSCITGITLAAFSWDRRELRLPCNLRQAAMSSQRALQSKFSIPTTT